MSFSRCRMGAAGESHDSPCPSPEEIKRTILPKIDRFDCCILSFTCLQTTYIENKDLVGVVAFGLFTEERKHVSLVLLLNFS